MNRSKKNIKSTLLIAVLVLNLVALTVLAGCSQQQGATASAAGKSDGDTIRIGVFQPLSGDDEENAKSEIAGIELAHKLYPYVSGKQAELVYADNKSDTTSAQYAAQKLINRNVDIVLGSYGNLLSMTGGEYFKDAEIPAIAITCTNPLVTKGNPYYFRINIVDSFQGTMAAKYVYEELDQTKAIVLKQAEDDYGSALSQEFSDKLESLINGDTGKAEVTITIEYKKGTEDFKRQLNKIKESDAKVVFLPCPAAEAAEIIKQAKQYGLDVLFIGTDLWHHEDFIELGGNAVEGAVFTTFFDSEHTVTDKTDEFLLAYRKEYGNDTPETGIALGFDAYLLAIHAIENQMENQTGNLRDSLAAIREYAGATGSITFDENGDPIKSIMIMTIENGEYHHKYTVEPQWN